MKQFDLVVIGSGAGLMVLEEALNQGLRCAIIEKSKFGGTCLTKGCIPSKMLVYPADLVRELQSSQRVGIQTAPPQVDWQTISRRMWEQIDLHKKIEHSLGHIPNLTVYKGTGAFTGTHNMTVHYADGTPDEQLTAERFVIAAGARTMVPQIAGLDDAGYVTSERFFGDKFPTAPYKSLAIIGGGTISAEFAHIFSAFGTKVTIIEYADELIAKEEAEVRAFVTAQFVKNGIEVLTGSEVVSASAEGGAKRLTVQNRRTGTQSTVECEEIFVAAGIRSNADLLAPEQAGIALDDRGWIITNEYLETSQRHIWALGDINGKFQLRHKANYEAQILTQNLFGGEKKAVSYDVVPWAIFTHPQVARVGMTEEQVKALGVRYAVAMNHYSEVVGGRAMGYSRQDDDNGFVKMLVCEQKKIMGVHIVGLNAAVLLQPFVYLMNAGHKCSPNSAVQLNPQEIGGLRIMCPQVGTYVPIFDSMVIHPSLSELTAWALDKLVWHDGEGKP